MKIVIDIPDKIYNAFHKGNWSVTYDGKKIRDIVIGGTPLPKGRGRMIILSEDVVKGEQTSFSFSGPKWISEVGLSNATVAIIDTDKK